MTLGMKGDLQDVEANLELQRAFAQSTKHIGYMPLEEEGKDEGEVEGGGIMRGARKGREGEGEGEGKDGGGEEARGVAARREMTSTTHGPGSDLETQDFDQIMPQCRCGKLRLKTAQTNNY
ncbi:hypothetical protein BDQ17DRAFT_1331974 [Cyathus striatus]|nr:hypothetical protein BDQ17DRAFT_1331974 [Cyathus striatus]